MIDDNKIESLDTPRAPKAEIEENNGVHENSDKKNYFDDGKEINADKKDNCDKNNNVDDKDDERDEKEANDNEENEESDEAHAADEAEAHESVKMTSLQKKGSRCRKCTSIFAFSSGARLVRCPVCRSVIEIMNKNILESSFRKVLKIVTKKVQFCIP